MIITLDKTYYARVDSPLLGYIGETESRTITLQGYQTEGADRYILRLSYADGAQYDVDITDGGYTVQASLLRAVGNVKCQVLAVKSTGADTYEYVKKSNVFVVTIKPSVGGDTPVPTYEETVAVLDKVFAAEVAAEENAQTAIDNAATATTAAETALTANNAAQAARTAAEQAATEAEDNKTTAVNAAQTANSAADVAVSARDTATAVQADVTAKAQTVATSAAQVAKDKQTVQAVADSIPTEYSDLSASVDELKGDLDLQSSILLRTSPNLIDMDAKVEKSIDENGKVLTNTRTWAWLNIPVNGGDKLVLSTNRLGTYDCFYVFSYNDDGYIADSIGYLTDFFNGTESGNYTKIYEVPQTAKYVNIYTLKNRIEGVNDIQLEVGEEPTEYKPYDYKEFKFADEIQDIANIKSDVANNKSDIANNKSDIANIKSAIANSDTYYINRYNLQNNLIEIVGNESVETSVYPISDETTITNPTEINAVENGVVNEKLRYMYCGHKMVVNPSFTSTVIPSDKCNGMDKNNNNHRGGSLELEFSYDGSEVEFIFQGDVNYRLKIDDKYISKEFVYLGANDGNRKRFKFVFDSARLRRLKFEIVNHNIFGGIIYDKTYSIQPCSYKKKPKAVFIGSSITESSSVIKYPHLGFPYRVAETLGMYCINCGVGATGIVGYPVDSEGNATRLGIWERLDTDIYVHNPDILYIGGSINDTDVDLAVFEEKYNYVLDSIRENLPYCYVICMGIFVPKPDGREQHFSEKNDVIVKCAKNHRMACIDELNGIVYGTDGNAIFNTGRWITGSGQVQGEKNDGNCDHYLGDQNTKDGVHMGIDGHKFIAEWISRVTHELIN